MALKSEFILLITFLLFHNVSHTQSTPGATRSFNVDTKNSFFKWRATKVLGAHEGLVNCKNGTITLQDSAIQEAFIAIDMNSIDVTDLSGQYREGLISHLKSEDFFDVINFQTAALKVKSAKIISKESAKITYKILADLTIKGITNEIIFEALSTTSNDDLFLETELKIDRTKFGIRYASKKIFKKLKNAAIADIFTLKVILAGNIQ